MSRLDLSDLSTSTQAETRLNAVLGSISLEWLVYVVVLVIALVARLADLNSFPLNSGEAREALAAYQIVQPEAAITKSMPVTAHQPFALAINAILMAIGGSSDMSARLGTVLMGTGLIFLPLLYRRWIGRERALLLSLLLALSPVLFASSRSMSGAVWALALVLLGGWLVGQYAERRQRWQAIVLVGIVLLLITGTEPSGFLLTLVIVGAFMLASYSMDTTETNYRVQLRTALTSFPWGTALAGGVGILVIVGTAFLLYPAGLTNLGEVLSQGIQGLWLRSQLTPIAYPLLISMTYEPLLWVMAMVGVYLIARNDMENSSPLMIYLARVCMSWLILAVVALLIYGQTTADLALWLTIPLAGLSTFALERMLSPLRARLFGAPLWSPLLFGAITAILVIINAINVLAVMRSILALNIVGQLPPVYSDVIFFVLLIGVACALYMLSGMLWNEKLQDTIALIAVALAFALLAKMIVPSLSGEVIKNFNSQIWGKLMIILLTAILLFVTFFLVDSTWGRGVAWRGLGIGLVFCLGAFGISVGWNSAVVNPDDPTSLWQSIPTLRNVRLIQDTLRDASLRAVGTQYDIDIVVQLPSETQSYLPLVWALHDFNQVSFVSNVSAAVRNSAVITPKTDSAPALGSNYVGQGFTLNNTWDFSQLTLPELPIWLINRTNLRLPLVTQPMILWLRADVYGLSPEQPVPPQPSSNVITP